MPDKFIESDIVPELLIDDLLSRYPRAAEVFVAHGMLCVGCYIGSFHTLEDVAAIYRLDLDGLIREIRQHVREDDSQA